MQVRHLPPEVSRGALSAANLGRRSEAVEATINERVKLVRRWRRAMSAGLTAQETCQDRDIEFCVLPPRSPKLNGRVERLQATYRYEFYGSYTLPHRIEPLNRCVDDFNHHYNRQRPHQALGGRTPWQYLDDRAA